MLRPLRQLSDAPTRSRLLAALRRVYLLALGALAAPGLLIGVPLGLSSRSPFSVEALLGLGFAAFICLVLALSLAHRKAKMAQPGTPEGRDLSIQAAIQAASAPAAPLLMALATLSTPLTSLPLLGVAVLALAAGWVSLTFWASRVGAADPEPVSVVQAPSL